MSGAPLGPSAKGLFSGRRVLVTGARGFIGQHLTRALAARGAVIYGVSRTPHPEDEGAPVWLEGDLADLTAVHRLYTAARPEVVFHLAGYVSGARGREAVLPALAGNLLTTVNLLTVAAAGGVRRIVLAGSLEEPDHGEPPCSPYAAAKWAAGGYARMFHALYGTPVVIARMFMSYGPGQMDGRKLIPHVITSLLEGTPPRLSSGQREVDWIYVSDVVAGLLAAAAAPDVEGSTLDLGSGRLVSIKDVVRKLVHLVGSPLQPHFGELPDRPLERVRVADVAAAEARLQWKPVVDLEEGLRRTVEWFRGHVKAPVAANGREGRNRP